MGPAVKPVFVSISKRSRGLSPLAALVGLCLLLTGCGPLHSISDRSDEIRHISGMREGTTTKEEALERLGEPNAVNAARNAISYHGSTATGLDCTTRQILRRRCTTVSQRPWSVTLFFDEADVLSRIAKSEDPVPRYAQARRDLRELARQGDAEAQYQLGRYYLKDEGAAAGFWLCQAAHRGHPLAQSTLGYLHREDRSHDLDAKLGFQRDNVTAFLWYSLASENGFGPAAGYREEVAEAMPPGGVDRAEDLAASWRPAPSTCAVTATKDWS